MEVLDLSYNILTSTIPTQIGLLIELRYLDLSSNLLSGTVPVALCEALSLESLYLCTNYDSNRVGCPRLCSIPLCIYNEPILKRVGNLSVYSELGHTYLPSSATQVTSGSYGSITSKLLFLYILTGFATIGILIIIYWCIKSRISHRTQYNLDVQEIDSSDEEIDSSSGILSVHIENSTLATSISDERTLNEL